MFKAFGSFGSKIWESIKSIASPLTEALGLGRQAEVEVSPAEVQREFRKVIRLEGISEQIASLAPDQYVPMQAYQEAPIPWAERFAYQVTMSGRATALAGGGYKAGQFARIQRDLTFSREMTIEEIQEEALAYFGTKDGPYFSIDITHVSVTAAWVRAGETVF